ncbi:uncharacterized protein LOC143570503 [Bidens hawaiensis]|uniref:uncharacterized protein LOC143570503 n=1 Tax=Bidens hawaiensis TaxID=980011 RepID=UPI00404B9697
MYDMFIVHHCLIYALNAFFGHSRLRLIRRGVHSRSVPLHFHPRCLLYSRVSRLFISNGLLDSVTGVPLTVKQCLLLVSAGSLSHFFLDHLFEENGHSTVYTWILGTGWWKGHAPVNPDAVVVVGFLCGCLIIGFIRINRMKGERNIRKQSGNSVKLLITIASMYCMWCASQIYLVDPPRPAVGEEADLGVILFLAVYFFLPHSLCIMSMNPPEPERLPL